MAFATISDLERRYGELPEGMQGRATALLEDAATMLEGMVTVDVSDPLQASRLEMVSCAMVNRSMQATESEVFGISEARYTMGPFVQSATFSNPSGDMYLTTNEKRLLGIGGTAIGTIRPRIGGHRC